MDALAQLPWVPIVGAAVVVVAGVGVIVYANRRPSGRVIKVVGVGSGGANAVEAMIRARIRGVEFVVVNTDARALRRSSARRKIQIGKAMTNGLGTGGDSSVGEKAARESAEAVSRALAGADLVVITAGLGGGTGSGASPVVGDIARQIGALTMAVVTKPFSFEGARRRRVAEAAAGLLADRVDAVATIPNDRVRDVIAAEATVDDAFGAIDGAVSRSIGEIVNLIAVPGRINLDFSDVRAVLAGGGAAVFGVGRGSGDHRAADAARSAMAATLLEGRIEGATSVLLSVAGSSKLKLAELDAVVRTVLASAGPDANLVFGMGQQPQLGDDIQVTMIATGLGRGRSSSGAPATEAEAAPVEEWRPVWLRRSGMAVDQMAATSRPRSARKKATPPKPAPGGADTPTG